MKLEIETKYNLGDEVYVLTSPNTYKQGIIIDINVVPIINDNLVIRYTIKYKYDKFETFVVDEINIFTNKQDIEIYIYNNELKNFYDSMDSLKEAFISNLPPQTLPQELIPFQKKLEEIKEMLDEFYNGFVPKDKYMF